MSFVYSNKLGYYILNADVRFVRYSGYTLVSNVVVMLMSKDFVFDPETDFEETGIIQYVEEWAENFYGEDADVGYKCVPGVPNGFIYTVTTAGTCGTVEPTWQVPTESSPTATTTDGTTVWTATWTGHTMEMPTANGYTAGGMYTTVDAVSYDSATGVATVTMDDFSWTATGGTLGDLGGNSTEISGILFLADGYVIGFSPFVPGKTVADTEILLVANNVLNLSL